MIRHIEDVGSVEANEISGVRVRDIGFDLGMAPDEARALAKALNEVADAVDAMPRKTLWASLAG
jgi:hypothetical protein